jgi:hypothetical protein
VESIFIFDDSGCSKDGSKEHFPESQHLACSHPSMPRYKPFASNTAFFPSYACATGPWEVRWPEADGLRTLIGVTSAAVILPASLRSSRFVGHCQTMPKKQVVKPDSFAAQYPNVARWVFGDGWIEIGQTEGSYSFVRALDLGGMVWEGETSYKSLDEALRALDTGIQTWFQENG